jgi:ABC-type lipoprotein export system ATPase subunit
MNKIKLENVWKNYGNLIALKDINLEINKGEIVVIIGPSGSGKTTLLNILGLIDKPTEGKVYLNQRYVGDLSEKEIADIRNREFGFIFNFFI